MKVMKKNLITYFTLVLLLFCFSCSTDDQPINFDESKEHIQSKNFDLISVGVGANGLGFEDANGQSANCVVRFTFSDPNLTPMEKTAIRNYYNNNHFTIVGFIYVSPTQEDWIVFCDEYNSYIDSITDDDGGINNCGDNGCVSTSSRPCDTELCGTGSGETPSDPIDPFDPDPDN